LQPAENSGIPAPQDSTDLQRKAAVFRNLVTTLLPRSLTVRQVAERINLSPSSVYELCASGELRHIRVRNVIRVPEVWLADFVRDAAR
jgi:excisionase family DNA binding protein